MFGLGPAEVILVLIIALIVFGPGRLPEIGQALGKSIREFREATSGITDEISREIEATERAARGETKPTKTEPTKAVRGETEPDRTEPAKTESTKQEQSTDDSA